MTPSWDLQTSRRWLVMGLAALAACSVDETVEQQAIAPASTTTWTLGVGGGGADSIDAIAVDPAGNVIAGGTFGADLSLGDQTYESKGGKDVYVAKMTSSGTMLWSLTFGADKSDQLTSLVVGRDGNIYVAGSFLGEVDFGGGTLTALGGSDIFVVKVDADGAHVWSKALGGTGLDGSGKLALVEGGGLLLAAEFSGTIEVGASAIVSAGSTDVFLTRFTTDGAIVRTSDFGGPEVESVSALATLSPSASLLTGSFDGSIKLPTASLSSNGSADAFMLKF